MSEAKNERNARQSRVRVKSGVRLVAVLSVVAVLGFLTDVIWLAKLSGVASFFFFAVTVLEYLNARRLESGAPLKKV